MSDYRAIWDIKHPLIKRVALLYERGSATPAALFFVRERGKHYAVFARYHDFFADGKTRRRLETGRIDITNAYSWLLNSRPPVSSRALLAPAEGGSATITGLFAPQSVQQGLSQWTPEWMLSYRREDGEQRSLLLFSSADLTVTFGDFKAGTEAAFPNVPVAMEHHSHPDACRTKCRFVARQAASIWSRRGLTTSEATITPHMAAHALLPFCRCRTHQPKSAEQGARESALAWKALLDKGAQILASAYDALNSPAPCVPPEKICDYRG